MPKKKTAAAAPTRAVRLINPPAPTLEVRQRWAIIVGISKYKDPELNLRYANRDAEALYDLIRTPAVGASTTITSCG